MADETLEDLFRQVLGRPAALTLADNSARPRRPMPRTMRPLPERMQDQDPGVRRQAMNQFERRGALTASADRGQAYAPPRNQVLEAGRMTSEAVGVAPLARVARDFNTGDPATVAMDAGMGALGVLGTATLGMGGRPAGALRPPVVRAPMGRMPAPPPREIGAGGLPIAPARPFRNSLRGGGDDLADAAAMGRSAPDAGSAQGGNAQPGWEPLFHGRSKAPGPWNGHMWASPRPSAASDYALNMRAGGEPNVMPIMGRTEGALEVNDWSDLESALGNRARLLDRFDESVDDVWDALDDANVKEALRANGVQVVRLPRDPSPSMNVGQGVPSYLFLDQSAVRPRFGVMPDRRNVMLTDDGPTGIAWERWTETDPAMHRAIKRVWDSPGVAQEVPIADLIGTQQFVDNNFARTASRSRAADDLPLVLRVNGQMRLIDGHHRVTATSAAGRPITRVRLLDIDAEMQRVAGRPDLDIDPPYTTPADEDVTHLDRLLAPYGWRTQNGKRTALPPPETGPTPARAGGEGAQTGSATPLYDAFGNQVNMGLPPLPEMGPVLPELGANDRGAIERAAALLRGERNARESTLPIGVRRTFDNVEIKDGLGMRVQPTREQLFGFDPQNIERNRNPWPEPELVVDNPARPLPDGGPPRPPDTSKSRRPAKPLFGAAFSLPRRK